MAAIGSLVAGLSHELNNPLGIILGYVQNLLRHVADDELLRKPLHAVERQTLRCRDLVHSLLDFSRLGTRAHEQVSPSELVEGVISLAAAEARTREVLLEMHMATSEFPIITVSRRDIESALLNLVSNALDVAPKGSAVSVSLIPALRDGREGILIEVRDSGPGIPFTDVNRIFDPFFTTKPEGKGTGLGLSLARQIVDSHGGQLDVQTREGAGTTMLLWLPARASGDAPYSIRSADSDDRRGERADP
jgi:signal transduction histidine kinase